MFFDEILYGIQYYRAPTPLPTEWETDLSGMVDRISVDTVQLRVQWRQNERRENEYDFSDIERLFALTEKYNLKVIVKFLMETAPQYIFDKYDGYRVNPDNSIIRGGSHGAFYVGGWIPCFHNEKVKERAELFVAEFCKRFANKKNIVLWNVWNEPRNRPVGECFCTHCRKAYGKWMKENYKNIEDFNAQFGTAEADFDCLQLPSMTQGFWDVYLYKRWTSGYALYDNLKMIYDKIRIYDKTRPIMSHSGFFSGHQKYLDDLGDENIMKKAVDFFGTSFPVEGDMQQTENALESRFTADYMRGVDKNFFVHEIYPSCGCFYAYDKPSDLKFKLWNILGAGAKGLVFWQYRAERIGNEMDCSGIVNMDGSEKDITSTVKSFGDFVHKYGKLFANAQAPQAPIAIGIDYDSRLISEIEDGTDAENTYNFDKSSKPLYNYHHTVKGGYNLFQDIGYDVDFVDLNSEKTFDGYKVVYLPYYTMADTENNEKLKNFVEDGGVLICDEGFALRDRKNTWLNIGAIPYDFLTAKMEKRRLCKGAETFMLNGKDVTVNPYKTLYKTNATPLATFTDGETAIHEFVYGKGKVLLLGASVGYSYYVNKEEGWRAFFEDYICKETGVSKKAYSNVLENVHHQTLLSEEGTIEIIENYSGKEIEILLPADAKILTEQTASGKIFLQPTEVVCFITK